MSKKSKPHYRAANHLQSGSTRQRAVRSASPPRRYKPVYRDLELEPSEWVRHDVVPAPPPPPAKRNGIAERARKEADKRRWHPDPTKKHTTRTLDGRPARVVALYTAVGGKNRSQSQERPSSRAARAGTHPGHTFAPWTENPFTGRLRPGAPKRAKLSKLAFATPSSVVDCIKRKMRAQVLHALGIAGRHRGGSGRHTPTSHIGC